jgi:hypothetical protein
MRLSLILILFTGLLLSPLSFSAACPESSETITAGNGNCTITGSESTIQVNFNSGFADAAAIAAVGGNAGTSVGAQRKLSFIKAAEILAEQLVSSQTIIVDAAFAALSCNSSSAVLGSAGAAASLANVDPMPAAAEYNTFYPVGLINSLGSTDYRSNLSDINSEFNSNIGNSGCLENSNGWYYGFDAAPDNYIGFTTVLLHEMTHGVGFASLVNASSGAKPGGLDDVFSNHLYSKSDAATWSNAGGLSDEQRADSAISNTDLLWHGSNVNTQAVDLLTAGYDDADMSNSFTSGDRVQMYAPDPVEGGSSVSHFDTAASPNEIMEPQYTEGQLNLGLALYLLKDIGWDIVVPSSTTIEVNGSAHGNGDTVILSDNSTQINVNNGSDTYSYSLTYNSSDASSLVSPNDTGLIISLPSSGEFAGDYTLTITDDGDGDVITITLTRPLRLNWSSTALLNGDTAQTLNIEGGAAGTVYGLVQSGNADLIFRDANEASVITVTAENNAESYNAARIGLDSLTVSDLSNMDVTVQSSYDDVVESGVNVYPSSLHQFTLKNISDVALENATATLNGAEQLLTELNILLIYNANGDGEFAVLLPDTFVLETESSYAIQLSAPGYHSKNLILNSNNTTHDVVLTEIVSSIILTGEITAQGSQDLSQAAPVVTIRYGDETTTLIAVAVTSENRASFSHEIDLNLKSLDLLTISQVKSVTVGLNVSNITQSQNLDILLNNAIIVPSIRVDNSESSSGGGSLIWFNLYLLCGLVLRYLLLKLGFKKVDMGSLQADLSIPLSKPKANFIAYTYARYYFFILIQKRLLD